MSARLLVPLLAPVVLVALVLLVRSRRSGVPRRLRWLLTGTVTLEAMARTASRLPAGVGDQLAGQPTRTEPCA